MLWAAIWNGGLAHRVQSQPKQREEESTQLWKSLQNSPHKPGCSTRINHGPKPTTQTLSDITIKTTTEQSTM